MYRVVIIDNEIFYHEKLIQENFYHGNFFSVRYASATTIADIVYVIKAQLLKPGEVYFYLKWW